MSINFDQLASIAVPGQERTNDPSFRPNNLVSAGLGAVTGYTVGTGINQRLEEIRHKHSFDDAINIIRNRFNMDEAEEIISKTPKKDFNSFSYKNAQKKLKQGHFHLEKAIEEIATYRKTLPHPLKFRHRIVYPVAIGAGLAGLASYFYNKLADKAQSEQREQSDDVARPYPLTLTP